jgi:hypothetical protein
VKHEAKKMGTSKAEVKKAAGSRGAWRRARTERGQLRCARSIKARMVTLGCWSETITSKLSLSTALALHLAGVSAGRA